MARPLRLAVPHAVYHVTSRGNARQPIAADEEDRRRVLATLAPVVDRYGGLCHACGLIDNQYHLLIETPQPNLSQGMRQLNGLYMQAYKTGDIAVWAISFKAASRPLWWKRRRIGWHGVGMSY